MSKSRAQAPDKSFQSCLSVWGLNNYGQLGIKPDKSSYIEEPTVLKLGYNVFGFTSGQFHSLFLTESLNVMGCGNNSYGQLGLGNTLDEVFQSDSIQPIKALSDSKIESIACGGCFCYALTTNGGLYSWGVNVKGQLGLGHYDDTFKPQYVNFRIDDDSSYREKKSAQQKQHSKTPVKIKDSVTTNLKKCLMAFEPKTSDTSFGPQLVQRSFSVEKNRVKLSKTQEVKNLMETQDLKMSELISPRDAVVEIACGELHTMIRTGTIISSK